MGEGSFSLPCRGFLSLSGPPTEDRCVGKTLEEAMRMVRGLEHLSCEERLRKGWDCSTWRRPHCGLKYLKGAYKKDEGTLFGRAMVLN